MLNTCAIIGRLTKDPELRQTQQGTSVCSFTIACDRNYTPKGQERQADFIDIVAWRGTADFVCQWFGKGQMIAVQGSLQTRTYQDKNGNNRKAVEIVADQVSFCGSKSDNQSQATAGQQPSRSYTPAQGAPNCGFSQGSNDDFAVIDDNEDLPF